MVSQFSTSLDFSHEPSQHISGVLWLDHWLVALRLEISIRTQQVCRTLHYLIIQPNVTKTKQKPQLQSVLR